MRSNVDIFDRPHAMIGDENVEASEVLHGLGHQGAGGFRILQIAGDWVAGGSATFFGQRFCLRASAAIAEGYFRARGGEHAHGGGADTSRAAGDESNFAGEGKRDGHGD